MHAYQQITWVGLGYALVLVAIVILVSYVQRLGLEHSIFIGVVRTFAQLYLIGYVLLFILGTMRWWLVALALAAMLSVATHNTLALQRVKVRGMVTWVGVCLLIGSGIPLLLVQNLIVVPTPRWNPQYLLPLAGMLLGNAMVGATLALNRFVGDLKSRFAEVEASLALGASPRQACYHLRREAARAAMLPSVSAMMTVGLVQLPGMMSGQIIAGLPPTEAVKYQIMVMLMLACAVSVATFLVLESVTYVVFARGALADMKLFAAEK